MKIINFNDIKKLNIPPMECYKWVDEMIKKKSSSYLPPKISMHLPKEGFCNVMPCIIDTDTMGKMGGVKVVNRYPERIPSLDSRLMLLNMENGEFLALMDANWITAMRTGAVAVHSIDLLAKREFDTVAIMGLGNTARATMMIIAEKYIDREIKVKLLCHKGQERIFAERFRQNKNLHFEFIKDIKEWAKGSEVIISCVTYAAEDFCPDECFDEGVLVVPVHTRGFTNCDLFFDKIYADDTGHVCHFKNFEKFRYFAEVSDVVNGKKEGRMNDRERILAYNIGLSIHDIYYASHIYEMLKDDDNLQNIEMESPVDKFWV